MKNNILSAFDCFGFYSLFVLLALMLMVFTAPNASTIRSVLKLAAAPVAFGGLASFTFSCYRLGIALRK